ncbi:high-affinity Zn(2+) transporter zrt1 [Orbilia oligospora]|uniref:High-affinity Zn(2+) transporter zrt1 n=1 Tax=Orbilia oligospora TaxID=2813651 RepID=A0A7C8KEN5_ORBOL|nr:high-affinity Zn(2+) transporter zrt1 [Orbilia oligospora]KAF3175483.1 high-affinity Zn(2+) transporter zrt1 [Orbilia oligospora]KAF3251976.1 high-affinity Zn(2+) transporter zrt1 [Orbilia oligospora]KAF3264814.1 high-affinity Zn(2+) transporter zrt1 [Orbilia oligospora]KAF3278092.1 high-affinity Zn(2+) transporter zrt1 [Orbilia oligospora]
MEAEASDAPFDPTNVDLTTADPVQIICFLSAEGNEYDGRLGIRIAALFVILIVSTVCTVFPVAARRAPGLKVPSYIYLFARYFGAGVIVATAFIHLLAPAYEAIGPASCVGMTGGWAEYAWPPAIALVSIMLIFLVDVIAERYAEAKFGATHGHDGGLENGRTEAEVTGEATSSKVTSMAGFSQEPKEASNENGKSDASGEYVGDVESVYNRRDFYSQFSAFLILEFGVIFHSVIIGLALGVAGEEFNTLFPVLVFHQGFEGLGIGARMSAIPFKTGSWLPWILCLAYGLSTPIAIAIGLGLRGSYNPGSFTANVVSGILDSLSAGILIYTGLVELLARDFLFDPKRTRDGRKLAFMLTCTILGAGLMALLGKWA